MDEKEYQDSSEEKYPENISIDYDLYMKYDQNLAVSNTTYYILVVAYSILIIAGSVGNLLVIIVVAHNKGKLPNYMLSSSLQEAFCV